jgi:hypothetical protein
VRLADEPPRPVVVAGRHDDPMVQGDPRDAHRPSPSDMIASASSSYTTTSIRDRAA